MTRRNLPAADNGHSRRRFLKSLSAGVMGFGLAEMLALQTAARAAGRSASGRAKNVLVVFEEGGMSHMDTFDPKPNVPVDHRSPFQPIATNVPGIHFTSVMPMIAQHADKLAVVRSMTALSSGHKPAVFGFFKGYREESPVDFPDIGSVVVERLGSECRTLPGYVFAPGLNMPNAVTSSGFLPSRYASWRMSNRGGTLGLGQDISAPGWKVAGLSLNAGLDADRLHTRRRLLDRLDQPFLERSADDRMETLRKHYETAYNMLASSEVERCFDFSSESDAIRDRYGRDHRGCCYLLGRKLIEAGVRFVTVTAMASPESVGRPPYGAAGGVFLNWDHHEGIYFNGPCGGPQGSRNQERYGMVHPVMMPSFDRAFSALLEDMDQRGLLAETLVCFVTEFGRTPRINKWQGRDHWSRAMSIAFAGAGVPGGQVIGRTTPDGGDADERVLTTYDYAETIYHKLGIDTDDRLSMPDGRPIDFTEGGRPIGEIF
jgi:hypothetical protein